RLPAVTGRVRLSRRRHGERPRRRGLAAVLVAALAGRPATGTPGRRPLVDGHLPRRTSPAGGCAAFRLRPGNAARRDVASGPDPADEPLAGRRRDRDPAAGGASPPAPADRR